MQRQQWEREVRSGGAALRPAGGGAGPLHRTCEELWGDLSEEEARSPAERSREEQGGAERSGAICRRSRWRSVSLPRRLRRLGGRSEASTAEATAEGAAAAMERATRSLLSRRPTTSSRSSCCARSSCGDRRQQSRHRTRRGRGGTGSRRRRLWAPGPPLQPSTAGWARRRL